MLLLLGSACAGTRGAPVADPLEPLSGSTRFVPDELDRAAKRLALAALGTDLAATSAARHELEAADLARTEEGERASGLVPAGMDLAAAAQGDPIAHREAARRILDRDDVDPALRAQLEQEIEDDPLALARARLRDERLRTFGRVFNAVAAPLGKSITTGFMAGVGLVRSLVGLAVIQHLEPEMSVPERQALAHWKRFLELHPEEPESALLLDRIENAQAAWSRTQHERYLRAARRAEEQQQPELAFVLSEMALRYLPEEREATRLRERAAAGVARAREERRRSLEAPGSEVLPPSARGLALALLQPGGEAGAAADRLLAEDPDGPLADEARFVRAALQGEAGHERAMWDGLGELAGEDPQHANMARHAYALVANPRQNPYGLFRAARARDRGERARWILLGPLFRGARDRDLPGPVEWLIDLPSFVDAFASLPNRLITYPWLRPWPFGREAAVHARRYLAQHPEGEHAPEVSAWLQAHEARRGNAYGAWRIAEGRADVDADALSDLRERAAKQALETSRREPRTDRRVKLLAQVAREFRDTEAASEAGHLARREHDEVTPQRIRISRDFLRENPQVAGPQGLGLRPELLDGELGNGELHASGVTLLGGRTLEFAFVGERDDKDAPPEIVRRDVSSERLARLVALLDETTLRNALVDPDNDLALDADRDLYFERARLGASGTPDARAGARSEYAYTSTRERFGLVRGREPILPFDIVIQGSLHDLGLGAFPRMRMPKPTPDAILYR